MLDLLDTWSAPRWSRSPWTTTAWSPLRAGLARRPVAVDAARADNPRRRRAHLPLLVAAVLEPSGAWVFEDDHAGDIATNSLRSLERTSPPAPSRASPSPSRAPHRLAAVGPTTWSASWWPAGCWVWWSSRLLQGVLLDLLADPTTAEQRLAATTTMPNDVRAWPMCG